MLSGPTLEVSFADLEGESVTRVGRGQGLTVSSKKESNLSV